MKTCPFCCSAIDAKHTGIFINGLWTVDCPFYSGEPVTIRHAPQRVIEKLRERDILDEIINASNQYHRDTGNAPKYVFLGDTEIGLAYKDMQTAGFLDRSISRTLTQYRKDIRDGTFQLHTPSSVVKVMAVDVDSFLLVTGDRK